jgi:protein TonB
MSALPSARLVRLGQWLQSALLHGFLLLCLATYHWHRHGSLSFNADDIRKISTGNLSTLSTDNAHFLDVFIEQSESTESHPTAVKLIEAPSDAKVEIATDLVADTKVVVKNDAQTEAKKNLQNDMTVRSARQRTQPTARPTAQPTAQASAAVNPSASQVSVKLLQAARPDHAHNPKPAYPLALRDLGLTGVVWLRVWVDKTGRPREIELAKGSGYRLFDEAALRAVQHWRFVPAKNEQQSLASWVEFAVRFEING